MLVIDTETRTDARQSLLFGSSKYFANGECLREVLFYADDLPTRDVRLLQRYVAKRQKNEHLILFTRKKFLEEFHRIVLNGKQLLVGFNLPFDLSRIAFDLEEVDSGIIHSVDSVYAEYVDPRRDEWQTKVVPALNKVPINKLVLETGRSRRMIIKARKGKVRPHRANQLLLISVLRKLGLI